jgi:hypothetical protein
MQRKLLKFITVAMPESPPKHVTDALCPLAKDATFFQLGGMKKILSHQLKFNLDSSFLQKKGVL